MECPRCGFHQPEELYCAHCGVHIPSALSRRKRKATVALGATALAVLLVGGVASLWWSKSLETPPPEPSSGPEERQAIPRIQPPPPLPSPRVVQPQQTAPSRKTLPISKKSAPPTPSAIASPTHTPASPVGSEASAPPIPEPDPEAQLRRWAAQEWVDRGRELPEEPEQQMYMYRKALEVDPGFAVAHYYLGMAHWRQADREAALNEFRMFWQGATLEERQGLPLPEEFTPEELGPASGEGEIP